MWVPLWKFTMPLFSPCYCLTPWVDGSMSLKEYYNPRGKYLKSSSKFNFCSYEIYIKCVFTPLLVFKELFVKGQISNFCKLGSLKPTRRLKKNEKPHNKCVLDLTFSSISACGYFVFSKRLKIVIPFFQDSLYLGFIEVDQPAILYKSDTVERPPWDTNTVLRATVFLFALTYRALHVLSSVSNECIQILVILRRLNCTYVETRPYSWRAYQIYP
jgi:hypothetical protein